MYKFDGLVFEEVGEVVVTDESCCRIEPLYDEYVSIFCHQLQYIINWIDKKDRNHAF